MMPQPRVQKSAMINMLIISKHDSLEEQKIGPNDFEITYSNGIYCSYIVNLIRCFMNMKLCDRKRRFKFLLQVSRLMRSLDNFYL